MDTQTAITALLLILIVVVPFSIHYFLQLRNQNKSYIPLEAAAAQNGYRLTKKQAFLQSVIGLDENAGVLFFLHHYPRQSELQQIPLHGLNQCRVITSKAGASALHEVPGRVELLLGFSQKKEKEERLLLYNITESGTALTDEILEARKWAAFLIERYVK